MISARMRLMAFLVAFASLSVTPLLADGVKSQVVGRELRSEKFASNKIGTSAVRKMAVYLPAGYDGATARYPVIYFLPNSFRELSR
jgi:hypothetical protein